VTESSSLESLVVWMAICVWRELARRRACWQLAVSVFELK